MKHDRKPAKKHRSQEKIHPELNNGFGDRARKIILAFFLLPLAIVLLGGGVLLYLFHGEEISNSSVHSRVQNTLQSLLGDDFEVSIEKTGLSLVSSSALSLDGEGVVIKRLRDNVIIANLDHVEVGLNILSVIQGNPRFDVLVIKNARLDMAGAARRGTPPLRLQAALQELGRSMGSLQKPFLDGTIRTIRVSGVTIAGAHLQRRITSDLIISEATISLDDQKQLNMSAEMSTALSGFSVNANWRETGNGGRQLTLGTGGISANEWLETAAVLPENVRGIGLDAEMRIDARFPFDAELQPLQPFVKLQTAAAKLRLGLKEARQVGSAVFNIQMFPPEGLVELQPSDISIGAKRVQLSGTAVAADSESGILGPLKFDLKALANRPAGEETPALEQVISVSGIFEPERFAVEIADLLVVSGAEKISGNFDLGFGNTSPSVKGTLRSEVLSPQNLLNAWPFHIAPKVQEWIAKNISGGKAEDFTMKIEVAQGRLAQLKDGDGFNKDEFQVNAKFSAITVNTIGDLPPLNRANGSFTVLGSRFSANVGSAVISAGSAGAVNVDTANLLVPNLFQINVPATLKATLSGDLKAMATVADMEPLNIAKTIALKPADLTGASTLKLELDFGMEKSDNPRKLDWKADVDLANATSKSPVLGRNVSKADLNISATPQMALIKGTAEIDGLNVKLDMNEPLKGGDDNLRRRVIKARLNHKDLAGLNINIDPIIRGNMAVEIVSGAGSQDLYKIDLTNADISLPWINWLKGNGIRADVSFALSQKDGVNTLSDFSLTGEGFKAGGKLAFGKSGLISANLANVTLVGGDQFDIAMERDGKRYIIKANGRAFDARAIIEMIIHKGSTNVAKGGNDVTLTANFGTMKGFKDQVMENALVNYRTDSGQLSKLEVRGALDGQLSTVDARREGNVTNFNFQAGNAGATLAMVKIYDKMLGGKLNANLSKTGDGPYQGGVKLKKFTVQGEERLSSLVAAPVSTRDLQNASGRLQELDLRKVSFDNMEATISKSPGYLAVESGRIRNNQIGLTFDGVLFDEKDQMSMRGTFMPLFIISRVLGEIPIIGQILSNGKNSGLIGITYRLRGPANNPQMAVNPISVIAPGIFRQVFEFKE